MKIRILAVLAALVLGTASAGGDGSVWLTKAPTISTQGGDGSVWLY